MGKTFNSACKAIYHLFIKMLQISILPPSQDVKMQVKSLFNVNHWTYKNIFSDLCHALHTYKEVHFIDKLNTTKLNTH